MSTVVVANVGNRDVTLNVGDEERPFWVAFEKGNDGKCARESLRCAEGAS